MRTLLFLFTPRNPAAAMIAALEPLIGPNTAILDLHGLGRRSSSPSSAGSDACGARAPPALGHFLLQYAAERPF